MTTIIRSGGKTKLVKRPPLRTYFARAIAKNDWHHVIAPGLRAEACTGDDDAAWIYSGVEHMVDTTNRGIKYVGPHFVSCDHGCLHGPNQHGALRGVDQDSGWEPLPGEPAIKDIRQAVFAANMQRIYKSDAMFAYLDKEDAEGTKFELGYGYAHAKPTYVFLSPKLSDKFVNNIWFIRQGARNVWRCGPQEAWTIFQREVGLLQPVPSGLVPRETAEAA